MENLFPLIFIVIALISIIGQIKKRSKPPGAAKASQVGWMQKLNTMLAELQQRLQQPPQGGAPGPSPWERLLKGSGLPDSPPDVPAAIRDEVQEVKSASRPARVRPVVPGRAPAAGRDKIPPVATAPPTLVASVAKGSATPLPRSRADLRKAVIWSEILGSPVALRDKS